MESKTELESVIRKLVSVVGQSRFPVSFKDTELSFTFYETAQVLFQPEQDLGQSFSTALYGQISAAKL